MKDNVTRALGRVQAAFKAFTPGQKVVALVGTGALLLAGFMVFKWAAAPSYAPLFSDLAPADASAIVEELDAQGVPYELSNGGNTIMVPREQVYTTRIALSGEGLPSGADGGGYSLLDDAGLSTSEFQEQTSFKRAMEGELSNTIEAIDGVDTAVVHLAIPQKEVFSDEQNPTTASVLVKTGAGDTLDPEQVQAIVNLVSSSVDGLDEDKVSVADSTGKVLSAPGGAGSAGGASTQTQQVQDFETRLNSQVQSLLDRVVGPGNSAVQIRADLSFDKSITETTRYFGDATALSETETSEILQGGDPNATAGGVVGPDGQMDTGAGGATGQNYEKSSRTSDNGVNTEVSTVEAAPGGVESLHVGIVVDPRAPSGDAAALEELVAAALGVDVDRGDTIEVTSMAFDRSAEENAAKELEASEKADKDAATWTMIRNGGLALFVVIIAVVAWFQSRRRAKARAQATEYVVEQLRQEALERQQRAALEAPAMLALETAQATEEEMVREEIASLVERQPEDVAALLRGWLVETR